MGTTRGITISTIAVTVALLAVLSGLLGGAPVAGAADRDPDRASRPPAVAATVTAAPFARQKAEARRLLAAEVRRQPLLKGAVVEFGRTPGGFQAVAYYEQGRIVISPDHTAPLAAIVAHECAHIVDWRVDGRIDRGDLPH